MTLLNERGLKNAGNENGSHRLGPNPHYPALPHQMCLITLQWRKPVRSATAQEWVPTWSTVSESNLSISRSCIGLGVKSSLGKTRWTKRTQPAEPSQVAIQNLADPILEHLPAPLAGLWASPPRLLLQFSLLSQITLRAPLCNNSQATTLLTAASTGKPQILFKEMCHICCGISVLPNRKTVISCLLGFYLFPWESLRKFWISSVQSLSRVSLFATPWTAAHQASLSISNSRSLFKLMSIELVMPSNHLIFCHPLLLLPSILPSIRVFSSESVLRIRWPKYWSFSFSISPYNEYSGLISYRMDWLDRLAVQGTVKSLLQHHSLKASILPRSAFFIVQLSYPHMTGKTIALTRQASVGKVMSLLLNMLSRLVITFLPRSKRLLISWLCSPSAVILEPQ